MPFTIDNMSPLAQGVSRDAKLTTFIGKTLPGEKVSANISKRKKNVQFASLQNVLIASDKRIEPACEHYQQCSACHYLHTDYANELELKRQALLAYFRPFNIAADFVQLEAAPQRSHYRNRVQLHYRHKYLGFIDGQSDEVLPVPKCQILRPELQAAFDALYADDSWTKEHSGRGHVELYWQQGEVKQSWNSSYAQGGFTQVNDTVNQKMTAKVQQLLESIKPKSLLDLFSGAGNLSNSYAEKPESAQLLRKMLDVSADNNHQDFIQTNLFDDDALTRFLQRSDLKKVDCLLIDPPRKGFERINEWVKKFKPKHIVYVSCDPVTLVRDLQSLSAKVSIEELYLFDMFPGTYHFETVVKLRLKY